jgi:hypothetical protein
VAVSSGSYRIQGSTKTCAGGTVSVISGSANPDGTTATAADTNYYRYDLIVANSSSQLGVLHGTVPAPAWPDYSVNPVFPTVTSAYAVLAAILIPPTASGITTLASTTIVPKNLAISADASHDAAHSLTGSNHTGMAKGSINVGTGVDTSTMLTVGSNTQVLTADSTQTSGTKWAAAAAGLAADSLWAAKGDIVVATANDTAAVITAPTTRGQRLGADEAGNVAWAPIGAAPKGYRVYDDMMYFTNLTVAANSTWCLGAVSVLMGGTAATANVDFGTVSHPGVYLFGTGSTTTGSSRLCSGAVTFGGGRHRFGAWVMLPVLSLVGERFEVVVGFADGATDATAVDGCFFTYRDDVSANWTVSTVANSVNTATHQVSTGIAVTATQWYLLEAEVNAAGTSVTYYVDGASVVTHSTNIPTGTTRSSNWTAGLTKSLGTTTRTLAVDAYYLEIDFTTAR